MASIRRIRITPAKISSPRITKPYLRTRLFRSLDAFRNRPLVWISGPAGAGKTTLAVSYLHARNFKFLWYQFDVRDADPAAFFYYLREAVSRSWPRRKENLPLLTPEYLAGLAAFTRNFFEMLYARAREPTVLVFDNFQDLPDDSVTQQLLEHALREIPAGIRVIFLSRSDPPAALSRFKIEQSLQMLDANSLKLTSSEARGLARLQNGPRVDFKRLEVLNDSIQGWVAGWILLLKHEGHSSNAIGFPREARDTVFEYFATELFVRAAPVAQELLLKTSLLPEVSVSSAVALTGITSAAAILEDLERNNYFTTRLTGAEPSYQFHPLFLAFLRERLARELSAAELGLLQSRAANLLCERAQYDEAAALMIESKDEKGLIGLALAQARALAQQGRFGTLEMWLRALNSQTRHSHPWLAYWFGTCRMITHLTEARGHLEVAFALFKEQGDYVGQYSAWAGIIESYYYQWDDFTHIDPWFTELESMQRHSALHQWPEVEVRVVYAAVTMLGFARGSTRQISAWVDRASTLWNSSRDLRSRGPMMACLGLYYFWSANADRLRVFLGELRQLATSETVDPFIRLQSHWILSCQWIIGDLDESEAWVERALTYGARIGMPIFESFFVSCRAAICQIRDDVTGAVRYTESLHRTLQPGRRIDVSLYLYYKSWSARRRGDYQASGGMLEEALEIANKADAGHGRAVIQAALAESLTPLGDSERAITLIDAAQNWACDSDNAMLMFICLLARAWDALRNLSEAQCRPLLSRAFAHGRENEFFLYPCWLAPKMSELCGVAVRHGIESEYTERLIRLRKLVPDPACAVRLEWPFPVKIYTLGRFSVLVENESLRFSGKVPKKPLELLRGLVALGGRRVGERVLAMALWPRAEDPMQALTTTLHRLRKLIGEETIERQDGHLGLNSRRVWVDVWALEEGLARVAAAAQAKDTDTLAPLIEHVLGLYGGGFLAGEAQAPWAIELRERLHSRLVRQLDSAATVMAEAGRHPDACALYHKALEMDPVSEVLHLKLMRCYQFMGRAGEALAAYEHCRSMLRKHFGTSPSADTEALARQLRDAGRQSVPDL